MPYYEQVYVERPADDYTEWDEVLDFLRDVRAWCTRRYETVRHYVSLTRDKLDIIFTVCVYQPYLFFCLVIKTYLLWLVICAMVHSLDWYFGEHGSLAHEVFSQLNPANPRYGRYWGDFTPAVNFAVDMLNPFSIVWTALLPHLLDETCYIRE